jgi:hypothetical protein
MKRGKQTWQSKRDAKERATIARRRTQQPVPLNNIRYSVRDVAVMTEAL